ncbi:hypothetical protein [Brevundimonas balnearis]|uniref:Vgr related protein n=1 Tax=Brevundimonas balnearis TaxID=1572858 RepID=A0ABV6R002_9CAUL
MIRALTPGERALASAAIGPALRLDTIRILAAPGLSRAFVPGRWLGRDWIIWPRRKLSADLSQAPLSRQAVFVHEMVHVLQSQSGVPLAVGKLKAGDSPESYRYPTHAACRWSDLNIEQQAMVIEHRFRRSRGGTTAAQPDFYERVRPD